MSSPPPLSHGRGTTFLTATIPSAASLFPPTFQIFEKKPTTIKNFGIWLRYQSRTGVHNMYKEYRELTLNAAVQHMYQEMASRHRVRVPYIQIIKTAVVPASQCKRVGVTQFHDSKIKFPLPALGYRPGKAEFKSTFKANMPNVSMR